jgi:tetratricopeptide (TPR) repeat protein
MPIESPDKEFFNVAVGYTQLGMFLEANEQLENIDPFNRVAPEVLALRVDIYRGLQKWDLMREIAGRLCEFDPTKVQWAISYAYATRRANDLNAARDILVASLPKFPREAIIYYNLACYDCQLGEIDSARQYLKQAFRIDPNWISQALEDQDLKPLWDYLGDLNKGHQLESPAAQPLPCLSIK